MRKFADKPTTKMQTKPEEHSKTYNEQDTAEHERIVQGMADKLLDKSLLDQHLSADGTEAKTGDTAKTTKDKLFGKQLNADGTEASPEDMHQKLKETTDKLF